MGRSFKAAALFSGWEETLLLSCLQGHMGILKTDGAENPRAASVTAGDFVPFFLTRRIICGGAWG